MRRQESASWHLGPSTRAQAGAFSNNIAHNTVVTVLNRQVCMCSVVLVCVCSVALSVRLGARDAACFH